MTKIYIPLEKEEAQALIALANREKRQVGMQAALFVRQGLEALRLLKPIPTDSE